MGHVRQLEVVILGDRFRVTYGEDGRVLDVQQQIIPFRYAIHWRRLHPMSKAWRAAVDAADRKLNR